jgi:(p)ppGpp synthase/HD superfamily hydrolase
MTILLSLQSDLGVVSRALLYASEAHAEIGQVRKYSGEPYIIHPIRVLRIVQTVNDDPEVHAATLMHDVIEDTKRTKKDIARHFGTRIANLVDEVSDVSTPQDGNRERRKEIDRLHLAEASDDGQTIKLADLIDNGEDIAEKDPKFAPTYLMEKSMLLLVLGRGNRTLHELATAQLRRHSAMYNIQLQEA